MDTVLILWIVGATIIVTAAFRPRRDKHAKALKDLAKQERARAALKKINRGR